MMFLLGTGRTRRSDGRWRTVSLLGLVGGRFDLEGIVNRAQIFTLLYRTINLLQGIPVTALGSDMFDDVPVGHWADEEIGWAVSNGVVSGVSETIFDLEGTVSRAEMVTFIQRTVNLIQGRPVASTMGPDGAILFTNDQDGDIEIFVMNADGTNERQLTNDPHYDEKPSWSPDGTQIAFQSDRDGDLEIFVMNADGTNVRQLTNNTHPERAPNWSPDGTQIAFQSYRDGDLDIFVMNADGTNERQLTNNTHHDWAPSWSPDGTQIAFQSDRGSGWQVFVMNADGTNERQLTPDRSNHGYPSWSPDGTQIAFQSDRGSGWQVFVMNADGTNERQLTPDRSNHGYPSWSPDGTRIAFQSDRGHSGNFEIYIMNADGTDRRRITNNTHEDNLSAQAWSSRTLGGGSEFFDDVPRGHEADRAIGWAFTNGITSGVGGGRFGPDGTVIRAQIVTFLYRTVNLLDPRTVRMGINPCCADAAIWQIPIEKGWFDELGITIEPAGGQILRSSADAISALRQGDMDVAPAWVPGLFGSLETFAQAVPPILFTDIYIGYMILVGPDSEAKTALEFMEEGMSFPDAAEEAVEQLVGKDIHIPPRSTQQPQYANALFAYLDEWQQDYKSGIPLLDREGNQMVKLNRNGNPLLDQAGNPQPILITSQDWRYYAKPQYVDDPTIVQLSATPGQIEFAMPYGGPTLAQMIRNGWEPLINFKMIFDHDPSSHPAAIATATTGGIGLIANREWAEVNKNTVYRLLSVGFRTLAYLEDPNTQADGWAIMANLINTHRHLSFDAVDIGIIWEMIDPPFTWEDQEALWDTNLPSYHFETSSTRQIEVLKARGVLSAGFDTETELSRFLLAQDLYYEMREMQQRSDELFAQAAGMELSNEQTALVQQARTFYQHYNFLDALRSLEKALGATSTNP